MAVCLSENVSPRAGAHSAQTLQCGQIGLGLEVAADLFQGAMAISSQPSLTPPWVRFTPAASPAARSSWGQIGIPRVVERAQVYGVGQT